MTTTGEITFTSEPGFSGQTTPLDYTVKDTSGASTEASITIDVKPVKPQAHDDHAHTDRDTAVVIDVTGNDESGSPKVPLKPEDRPGHRQGHR